MSLKNSAVTLGSASVTLITGGWEFEHIDISALDIGQAKVALGYENGEFDATAMASAWVPSFTIKLWDVSITLSAHIGSIGGQVNIGTGKFNVGGACGLGASLSVDW